MQSVSHDLIIPVLACVQHSVSEDATHASLVDCITIIQRSIYYVVMWIPPEDGRSRYVYAADNLQYLYVEPSARVVSLLPSRLGLQKRERDALSSGCTVPAGSLSSCKWIGRM